MQEYALNLLFIALILIRSIDLFHKSENDLSFADYLYRKIFNIHA